MTVKVIAGESMGAESSIRTLTPVIFLDFKLDRDASFTQSLPDGWNAFILVLEGVGLFGATETEVKELHCCILGKKGSISFKNKESRQLNFILLAGQPLNEVN